jgi:hypothetical protein
MRITLYPDGIAFVNRQITLEAGETDYLIPHIPKTVIDGTFMFNFGAESDNVVVSEYELLPAEEGFNLKLVVEQVEEKDYVLHLFYQMSQIFSDVFYTWLFDGSENVMNIAGWLSVWNQTGLEYKDVELQIVIRENVKDNIIFNIDKPANLLIDQKVKISLINIGNIPVQRKLVLPNNKIEVTECVSLYNTSEYKLGIPLMGGFVKIYFKDDNNYIHGLGEDQTTSYLPDDELIFEIGDASHIVIAQRSWVSETARSIFLQNLTNQVIDVSFEEFIGDRKLLQSDIQVTVEDGILSGVARVLPNGNVKILYHLQPIELL